MSIFRKPKKNIQRRVFSSYEDENTNDESKIEVDDHSNSNINLNIEIKCKKDERQKQKTTLLSFDDEEADGEVFQVKKSSHSKKIMRLLDKERKKKKEKLNVCNNEVQQVIGNENDTNNISEILPLNNSNSLIILNGRAALVAGKDDVSSDEDNSVQALHRFSHSENVKIVVESGIIPDAAMIHAARKRRQRARELGTDYIPLEQTEKKDKGRFIREEDGDGSDEERLDMSVDTEEQDKITRREQFFAAQDQDSDPESDQETEEWENQQIKKGVTGAQINITQQDSGFSSSLFNNNCDTLISSMTELKKSEDGPKTPITIAKKLQERLGSLNMAYEEHKKHLTQTVNDLEVVQNELLDLKQKVPDCAKRFRFYQELRGYVTDLVECLDEKVQLVTSVENRWLDLIGKKSMALSERRRQDVRDQAEEITLQTRIGIRRMSGPEEETRIRRAAEREGRRNRRRRAREQAILQQSQTQSKHLEGMSSDDEIPEQENIQFRQQKEQILIDVDKIFSDVVEEFISVDAILERFDSWRNVDFNAYCEAYASLVLPKILGPVLKMQLLTWDPLNSDSVDLELLPCTRKLMLYGMKNDESESALRSDPDVLLVPSVVDRIIIPKLTSIVEKVWDPMSSSQSLRLVGLIGRYVKRYPTLGIGSKSLTLLLMAVMDKLQQAVEHDVFIPIFPKQVLETKTPFFQRQFNSAVKLLGNITCWQGTLADHLLKDLALNSLLNRYLLSGLRVCQLTDAVAKAQLILNVLPRVWLYGEVQTDLQMFIAFILQLAGDLNRDNPLHLESLEITTSIRNTLHI